LDIHDLASYRIFCSSVQPEKAGDEKDDDDDADDIEDIHGYTPIEAYAISE
jgi:hypothetical protein